MKIKQKREAMYVYSLKSRFILKNIENVLITIRLPSPQENYATECYLIRLPFLICKLLAITRVEIMATTYTTECCFCSKKFKSFYTLKKHCLLKHSEADWENFIPVFKDKESRSASLPVAKDLSASSNFDHYKVWLAGLVERINSLFHPRLPGKFHLF